MMSYSERSLTELKEVKRCPIMSKRKQPEANRDASLTVTATGATPAQSCLEVSDTVRDTAKCTRVQTAEYADLPRTKRKSLMLAVLRRLHNR